MSNELGKIYGPKSRAAILKLYCVVPGISIPKSDKSDNYTTRKFVVFVYTFIF